MGLDEPTRGGIASTGKQTIVAPYRSTVVLALCGGELALDCGSHVAATRGARASHLTPLSLTGTRPPVDLYCYYLFLQREGSEDTLDFWLDVQQHENLC